MNGAELLDAIKPVAKFNGWLLHHDRPARRKDGRWYTAVEGDAGFPDLVLARDGDVLFVELKGDGDEMGPEQERWQKALGNDPILAQLRRYSHETRIWTPTDWVEEVIIGMLAR